MEPVHIQQAQQREIEPLIPILLLAEPSEPALRWSLGHLSDAVYRLSLGELALGAATVRWREDPVEIVELAVQAGQQGKGYGRQLVHWIIDEAGRRGKTKVIVGTDNASLGNIRFYQRCGLRMDHVRRNYFWYYKEPVIKEGIAVRDMLVFSINLGENGLADETAR